MILGACEISFLLNYENNDEVTILLKFGCKFYGTKKWHNRDNRDPYEFSKTGTQFKLPL